jgi:chromosome segregation ATPase
MLLSEAQKVTAEKISLLRQETRAAEALLGAVKVSQARERQATGDLRAAKDAERAALVKADEARARVEALEVELKKVRGELTERERRYREATQQLTDLEKRLEAKSSECEEFQRRLQDAEVAFEAERKVWEQRVVTNAEVRLEEFKRRVGSRVKRLMADVPPRGQAFPDTLTSILNDRLHEVLDALHAEGINATDKG